MKNIYLECGRVLGAHGVRGAIKVEPWCDSPEVLAGVKRVFVAVEGGFEERSVFRASVAGQLVLLTIEGISDRDAAVGARGTVLYLHRDDIPVPEGAMLLDDMLGLAVVDARDDRLYGTVSAVDEVPRGLLYTITTPEGREVLFPSVPEFIKEIDPEKGMLITPISGFFD